MYYSKKEDLKQLPEASSCPKFSGTREYDHMELMDYVDGLFIDVPSIPDYWITARLNTELKGRASIWYTAMKEILGRRNWPWWKSQIIQKYRNDEESQTPDTTARMTRASVKSSCNHNCTLENIADNLKDVRKRTNIGKKPHIKEVVSKRNNLLGWSSKTNTEKEWQKWLRIKILVTIVVQQTTMPTTVQRERRKSMPLRKYQKNNPQQRILTKPLWEMPSENNLMKSKTQEKNFYWNTKRKSH
ncbi:hypothetical protein O181_022370 [Austropuccinia psidii MF-1]|uniref:Uncharacterized protein n=1 Tax=Austropuccinia psidii MF-1 TaxID=1389203 RepID=A0A9Q3CH91_9BASI|nr:hypothetical protein [Austropuccinia psidii MF-1]